MATTVAEHNVVLLAPSGKEQAVVLRVTRAGIQLVTAQENRVRTHQFPRQLLCLYHFHPSYERDCQNASFLVQG
jgi:hypothetical protein